MAYGLGRQVWAIVLDEPTNYLDMPAIERLEDALAEYPGAMVIVTHDDALARRCANVEWRLGAGIVEVAGPRSMHLSQERRSASRPSEQT